MIIRTVKYVMLMNMGFAVAIGQADPANPWDEPQAVQTDLPVLHADSPVKDIMLALVIPASDALWSVQEEPEDKAVWEFVHSNAEKLTQAGNLLLDEVRARDGETWSQQAQALIDSALMAKEASEDMSIDALFNATDALYSTCISCHTVYLPEKTDP